MAIVTPPTITPAPTPAPQRGDRTTFSNRVDAFVTWLTLAVAQFAAVAANVAANATEAMGFATAAQGFRDTAQTYRDAAQSARDLAQTYRDAALGYRDDAADSASDSAASAAASAASATSLTANSTTTFAVGNGTKVFAVPAGKQFPPGEPLTIASVGTPALKMFGPVATYSGTLLTVNVTSFEGSGSAADWVIAPGGAVGATGGTAGGQLTSAIDEKKGTDLASAATIDPWSTGGNLMDLTGNATITGIAPAPQAGARRTLKATGAPTITNTAAILVKGGTNLLAPGDEIDIEAETTTQFNVTIRRGDGSATAATLFRNAVFYESSTVWVAPRDGLVRFHVKGSDGSGAVAVGGGAFGRAAAASGGSAGGYAIRTVYVKAGDSFSISTGARALGVSGVTGTTLNGNNGGATTITGPGVAVTCNGGLGGNATVVLGGVSVAPGTATALGVAGGSATGGDVNVTGGASGTATATNTSVSNTTAAAATGGGAFGYKGAAQPSGNATASASSTGAVYAASGGAGVGGASAAASATNSTAALMYDITGGGGALGPSPTTAVNTGTVAGGVGMPSALAQTPITLNGAGGTGLSSGAIAAPASPPAGAGTGALLPTNQTSSLIGPAALFAASGAVSGISGNNVMSSGQADYGGGSGGLATGTSSAAQASGDAGKAWVLVEYN